MTRATVHCTACDWSGRRLDADDLDPCPACGESVTVSKQGRGRPPTGRTALHLRVLEHTAAVLSPATAAAVLDEAAKRLRSRR